VASTACKATTKDGQPCRAWALHGSDFCFQHDPSKAQERKEARSKGGRARHGRKLDADRGRVVQLDTLADVVRLVEGAVGDLLQLENSVSRARAVGYLAGIAVKALQVSELEERIARLEREVGV